jgi:hypothetical protein
LRLRYAALHRIWLRIEALEINSQPRSSVNQHRNENLSEDTSRKSIVIQTQRARRKSVVTGGRNASMTSMEASESHDVESVEELIDLWFEK